MKASHLCHKLLFVLILITLTSCEKFVEVSPPTTQLTTVNVFNDNETATAAVTSIYNSMFNNTMQLQVYTGFSGDELTSYISNTLYTHLYTNALDGLNDPASFSGLWGNSYSYIFQANNILEGLANSANIKESVRQQLSGEAKFIRAFWMFYLTNLFGDVPVVTSTDYHITGRAARMAQAKVYEQIIADLKDAKALLNVGFVDASTISSYPIATAERVRPTKAAASTLLARVYLYTGDWINAEAESTQVIDNNTMFNLLPTSSLNKVFLMNSKEAIWQLQAPPNVFYTAEGYSFILTTAPANNGSYGTALSSQLMNAFEFNDQRKSNWTKSYTTTTPLTTYNFPFKYRADRTSTVISEYVTVFRLAELYLIRSEARAHGAGGGLSGSISDLNIIRNRAGLANTTASDQSSLLTAIFRERQVELFTEWAHRWFDLKRSGMIDNVMTNITLQKGGAGWKSYQQLYPIPLTDIQNNQNLSQTPGY